MTTPETKAPETVQNELLQDPNLSDGSELIPAEAAVRGDRQDSPLPPHAQKGTSTTESLKATHGQTVDQEGLTNNYAVTPDMYLQQRQRFGFTPTAERLNGRAAMLGFVALVLTEWITGSSLVNLLTGS